MHVSDEYRYDLIFAETLPGSFLGEDYLALCH